MKYFLKVYKKCDIITIEVSKELYDSIWWTGFSDGCNNYKGIDYEELTDEFKFNYGL